MKRNRVVWTFAGGALLLVLASSLAYRRPHWSEAALNAASNHAGVNAVSQNSTPRRIARVADPNDAGRFEYPRHPLASPQPRHEAVRPALQQPTAGSAADPVSPGVADWRGEGLYAAPQARAAAGDQSNTQAVLRARWGVESADPNWTRSAREYLGMALADAKIPSSSLRALDCRTTLCRIQFQFSSAAQAARLYQLRQPDYKLEFFGSGKDYTVFAAREGDELPEDTPQDTPQDVPTP